LGRGLEVAGVGERRQDDGAVAGGFEVGVPGDEVRREPRVQLLRDSPPFFRLSRSEDDGTASSREAEREPPAVFSRAAAGTRPSFPMTSPAPPAISSPTAISLTRSFRPRGSTSPR